MTSNDIFADISPGSIDFSPYQPASTVKIILEDNELLYASEGRMERFWRVWYAERSFYAPKLQTLVLGLRPQTESWEGVRRFIDYFESDVLSRFPKVGLDIYILADATEGPNMRRVLGDKPRRIHSLRAPPAETAVV